MEAGEEAKGAKKNGVCCEIQTPPVTRLEPGGRKARAEGETKCDARLPSGVSRIICIIRVESFSLGALMGLWDPRFGYTIFFFPSSPPCRWNERKRSENTNRREYPLFCH